MEGVIALLFTEDAHAVFLFFGSVAFIIQLCQPNCERKQDKQEHPKELSKILKHLSHGNLWNILYECSLKLLGNKCEILNGQEIRGRHTYEPQTIAFFPSV